MAAFAIEFGLHYVNLTEHVGETEQIIEMSRQAETGFILQSGLAPGYVDVLAHHVYKEFIAEFGDQHVERIAMKVGALPKRATGPHYYGFTWSPIGVATEYVKNAVIIKDGIKTECSSLSNTTNLILDGIHYEDDFTSGGAADLPDFFAGKVKYLDYKTIRYPGHFSWVRQMLKDIPATTNKEDFLLKKMSSEVPHSEDDMIILYVAVQGLDSKGVLRIKERSLKIEPSYVGSHRLKAIQTATAAPMLEAARMLLGGNLRGPILQSQIDTSTFLQGSFVQTVYNQKRLKEFA